MPEQVRVAKRRMLRAREQRAEDLVLREEAGERRKPAIASVAIHIRRNVTGMYFLSPPMLRMSCASSWFVDARVHRVMTEPAPRNSSALKKACVKTWKKPAANAPTPTPRNMKPSWLTVEYASTFLMSFCTRRDRRREERGERADERDDDLARRAPSKRGHVRAIRYTPAVTIVAAWMSAETGVGPAIASGSQT